MFLVGSIPIPIKICQTASYYTVRIPEIQSARKGLLLVEVGATPDSLEI